MAGYPGGLDVRYDSGVIRRGCLALLLLSTAASAAAAVHLEFTPPIRVGVLIFFALFLWGLLGLRVGPVNILPRLLIVLFGLPFSVLLGYFLDPGYLWMRSARGMDLIQDASLVSSMITVGIVGLAAMLAGFLTATLFPPQARGKAVASGSPTSVSGPTLDLWVFLGLLGVALGLAAMSAPEGTIFDAAYRSLEQGRAVAEQVNFAAAALVAFLVVILLALDTERERSTGLRWFKLLCVVAMAFLIVVYFQLLRGSRDSIGLLAALMALYLVTPLGSGFGLSPTLRARKRALRLIVPSTMVVALFLVVGYARNAAALGGLEVDLWALLRLGYEQNTWTAVLWTNLAVAWERHTDVLEYLWGATYRDYLLSLPPGVVTSALGFERPVEAWQNLGRSDLAGITVGGLHAAVTPFRNFGAMGVMGVLFLWGVGTGLLERWALEGGRYFPRLLWAAVICGSFKWFWYGDMPMVRTLMAAVLLYWMYRLALGLRLYRLPARVGLTPSLQGEMTHGG